MNTIQVLYHLALADLYERTRRYGFLLTLAAVIFLGVLVNNGTLGVDLGSPESTHLGIRYRGEFNSAWIGMMTVLVTNFLLSLVGFYLVSDSIKRDIHTGVGQIIATTPLRRATYLLGKLISNFVLLAVLVLILAVAALIMVLFQSETALNPGALLMPFFAVALPTMALTAALAVFFETVPWLRGALGNVAYFFLWLFWAPALSMVGSLLPFIRDPIGYSIFSDSLTAAASAAFPNETFRGISTGAAPGFTLKVFPWPGLDWTPGIVAGQWVWAILGLGLVLFSAIWFARFDPSRKGLIRVRRKTEESEDGVPPRPRLKVSKIALPSLSPLVSKLAQVSPFMGVLFAELRLLLNGRRWWWWAITIGINYAILVSPLEVTMGSLLPVAWLWPLALWSGMGNRERKNNTSQMVFSSARPVLRQLPGAWLAGVLATALLVIAGAVFYLSNNNLLGLVGWTGAVIFVPTLALALGVFSSGNRVFEVIYVIWWYIGPIQKMQGLDFTNGVPLIYLSAAAGLLLLSMYWRGRQVRV